MWYLAFISFLLLGGYLLLMAFRFSIPNMVSDTYYQLQPTTGSEIAPFKQPRNMGWIFSLIMVAVAFLMLICILDTGMGIQSLAFLGCAGLCFVGFAPNYCDRDAYSVHKTAAIVAAAGCVGWCLSVCWWITFVIALLYTIYLVAIDFFKIANNFWYIGKDVKFHPWYWLEIAGFADVFLTYLFVELFII